MGLQTDLQHAQREAKVARQLLLGGRVEVASVIDVSHDKAVVAAEARLKSLEASERRLTELADKILTKSGIKTDKEMALSRRELMEAAVEAELSVAQHHAAAVASRLETARARVKHLTAALDATRKLEGQQQQQQQQQQPSDLSSSELEHRLSQLHQSLARARAQVLDLKQAAAKAQVDLVKRREASDKLKAASSSMIETEMQKYVHQQQASLKALMAEKKAEIEKLRAQVQTVLQQNGKLQV
jgi:chromosome segregation ATPase